MWQRIGSDLNTQPSHLYMSMLPALAVFFMHSIYFSIRLACQEHFPPVFKYSSACRLTRTVSFLLVPRAHKLQISLASWPDLYCTGPESRRRLIHVTYVHMQSSYRFSRCFCGPIPCCLIKLMTLRLALRSKALKLFRPKSVSSASGFSARGLEDDEARSNNLFPFF